MKRVIILSGLSLFGIGIQSLLSNEKDIEIVPRDNKVCDIVKCIQENKPDALIINCEDPTQDLTQAVLCALREWYDMSIIGLSEEQNLVTVFRREQKPILQIEDLLSVIKS